MVAITINLLKGSVFLGVIGKVRDLARVPDTQRFETSLNRTLQDTSIHRP